MAPSEPEPKQLSRPRAWLAERTAQDGLHALVVAALIAVAMGMHSVHWHWYIEDAAITFAYARNLVEGEGLVSWPGGPRVEGYSNPTWVAVIAVFHALGWDGFTSARYIQAVLAGATLPLVYLFTREVTPKGSHLPLVATAFLAFNAQFALWGAAGLENALFSFLMAAALWRMFAELRTRRWPWSALLWFLLAVSRPEAVLYAAVGGATSMAFTLLDKRGPLPTVKWLATFFVPFTAYHAVRFWYFAAEFPNTYYAKQDHKTVKWGWNTRGWKQFRNFSNELRHADFAPVYLLGVVGGRGWRVLAAMAALLVIALAALLPGDQRLLLPVVLAFTFCAYWLALRASNSEPPRAAIIGGFIGAALLIVLAEWLRAQGHAPRTLPSPPWMRDAAGYVLAAAVPVLGLLSIGSDGWRARVTCWLLGSITVFFTVYTFGDWMKGFRWLSFAAVPASLLFARGVGDVAAIASELFGRARAAVPARGARLVAQGLARWVVASGGLAAAAWAGQKLYDTRADTDANTALLALGVGLALAGAAPLLRGASGLDTPAFFTVGLLLAGIVPAQIAHNKSVTQKRDATPYGIKKRVDYVQKVTDRLHLEERVIDLDVDMGAHIYWSDFEILDIAGLVDIPMGRHKFERSFIREYIFQEKRPHVAHVHGGWASNSRIPTHPEWRTDYFEVPGYPISKRTLHIGTFIRRDLVFEPRWTGAPGRRVPFEDGVSLEGLDLPSPEVSPGRHFYVELGVRTRKRPRSDDIRMLMFADDGGGNLATWDLPLSYDWEQPHDWDPKEVFHGRFEFAVPEHLPEGSYALGFVLIDGDGLVRSAVPGEALPEGVTVATTDAAFAAGEVRFADALQLVSLDELSRFAKEDREEAYAAAADGRCEDAEGAWFRSRKHRPQDPTWLAQHEPAVATALATCWLQSARAEPELAVDHLERARNWDRHHPELRSAQRPVTRELYSAGKAAYEAEDWETAYRTLSRALRVDPTHSWAMRYAERARARRLGIGPEDKEAKEQERKARAAEVEARRAKAEAARKSEPVRGPEEPDDED